MANEEAAEEIISGKATTLVKFVSVVSFILVGQSSAVHEDSAQSGSTLQHSFDSSSDLEQSRWPIAEHCDSASKNVNAVSQIRLGEEQLKLRPVIVSPQQTTDLAEDGKFDAHPKLSSTTDNGVSGKRHGDSNR